MDNGSDIDSRQSVVVRVVNDWGLHARPAARLAQEAQKYDADIFMSVNGSEVDAKSILDILTLAVQKGTEVRLSASGADADRALDELSVFVRDRLGEEK